MYNAAVSPETLQQVKNEGQAEAVRENGDTVHHYFRANKTDQNGRSKRL